MFDKINQRVIEAGLNSPTSAMERKWLWKTARCVPIFSGTKNKLLLECGTLSAVSTLYLADGLRSGLATGRHQSADCRLISLDNYKDYSLNPDKGNDLVANRKRIEEFGYSDLVQLHETDDISFVNSLPDLSVAMAFVDSWHVASHVLALLKAITPKICTNGIILCHDRFFTEYGVVYAISDWLDTLPESYIGGTGQQESLWWAIIRRKEE